MSLRVLLLSDAIIFFFLSPFSFSNVFLFFIPGAFSQSRLLVVLRPDSRNRFLFFACLPFAFLFFCPPYKQMYIVLCYCCCYSTSRCFSYTDIYRAYNIRMLNYAFTDGNRLLSLAVFVGISSQFVRIECGISTL